MMSLAITFSTSIAAPWALPNLERANASLTRIRNSAELVEVGQLLSASRQFAEVGVCCPLHSSKPNYD